MAQDKYQPILNEVKTQPYIRPGVQDRSAGIMTNTIAGLIPGAVEGYENYKVGEWIKDEVNPLITQAENYMEETNRNVALGADLSVIESEMDIALGSDKGLAAYNTRVEPMLQSYDKNFAVLKAAQEQGKISPEQFQAMYTKSLREAVNKNPWLEQKLYAKSQQHMQAMGILDEISSYEKAQVAAAKAQRDEYERWEKRAFEKHIPVTPEMTVDDIRMKVNEISKQEAGNAALDRAIDNKIKLQELYLANPENTEQIMGTLSYRANVQFTEGLRQLQAVGQNPQAIATTLAAFEKKTHDDIAAMRSTVTASPTGTKLIDAYEQSVKANFEILRKMGTGEHATQVIKNMLTTVESQQKLDFRRSYPKWETLNASAQVLSLMGVKYTDLFGKDPGKAEKFLRGTADMMTTGMQEGNRATLPEAVDFVASGAAVDVFNGFASNTENFQAAENRAMFSQYIGGMTAAVNSPTMSPVEAARTSNIVLQKVAQQPEFKMMSNDPQFSTNVTRLVDTSMKQISADLFDVITSEYEANPDFKVVYDVLPNGVFVIDSPDAGVSQQMTDKFTNQVNNALDAYAVSQGMTRDQAKNTFYTTYFKDLVGEDKDIYGEGDWMQRPLEVYTPPVEGIQPPASVSTPSVQPVTPVTGKSLRAAQQDIQKRLDALKKVHPVTGTSKSKLDQDTWDRRMKALLDEGSRLAEMDN